MFVLKLVSLPVLVATALAGCSSGGRPGATGQPHKVAAKKLTSSEEAVCSVIENAELPTGDVASAMQGGIDTLRRLQPTAPAGIRSDLAVIVAFDQHFLDAVRGGADPDSIEPTPQFVTALHHEQTWAAAHC